MAGNVFWIRGVQTSEGQITVRRDETTAGQGRPRMENHQPFPIKTIKKKVIYNYSDNRGFIGV